MCLVIGMVASVLAVYNVICNMFPPPATESTVVRVFVGQIANRDDESLSGNAPDIVIWGETGFAMAQGMYYDDGMIEAGTHEDIDLKHARGKGAMSPAYMSVSMPYNDALCISALTMTFPDGSHHALTGDIGIACGADWHWSRLELGSDHETPRCMWLDRDHTNAIKHQGFHFHILDFDGSRSRALQYQRVPESMCHPARFHMRKTLSFVDPIYIFSSPLEYNRDMSDKDISRLLDHKHGKRDPVVASPKNQTIWLDQLYKSQHPNQTATELCSSVAAVGPDYVSLAEGLMCDMTTRELWRLCDGETDEACFDNEQDLFRLEMRSASSMTGRAMVTRDVPVKKYRVVHRW